MVSTKTMNMLEMLSAWLLIVGGLNWGLVGLSGTNFVEMLLGGWPTLVTLLYVLVGAAALMKLVMMIRKAM